MNDALKMNANELFNKVPEVLLYFWIIKIMATTVGETAADFLIFNLNFGLSVTSLVMTGLLLASLVAQLNATRYVPWQYWLTVVLISVVGTLITDNLTDNFGVPLAVTTAAFSLALMAALSNWLGQRSGVDGQGQAVWTGLVGEFQAGRNAVLQMLQQLQRSGEIIQKDLKAEHATLIALQADEAAPTMPAAPPRMAASP